MIDGFNRVDSFPQTPSSSSPSLATVDLKLRSLAPEGCYILRCAALTLVGRGAFSEWSGEVMLLAPLSAEDAAEVAVQKKDKSKRYGIALEEDDDEEKEDEEDWNVEEETKDSQLLLTS